MYKLKSECKHSKYSLYSTFLQSLKIELPLHIKEANLTGIIFNCISGTYATKMQVNIENGNRFRSMDAPYS